MNSNCYRKKSNIKSKRIIRRRKLKKQRLLSSIMVLSLICIVFYNAYIAFGDTVHTTYKIRDDAFQNTISHEYHDDTEKTDFESDEIINNDELYYSDWNLILVNRWIKVPEDFTVKTKTLSSGHSIDERAYDDLIQMLNDAESQGLSPIVCSSLRTVDKQMSLYNSEVQKYINMGYSKEEAQKEAQKWVALPGTSEHHTGLALDIVSSEYQLLDEHQENTKEQKWLIENSYKYGFILRYPSNKSDITGINYEPWHYRYVGKEAAKEINEMGICLEEYLDIKQNSKINT